MKIAKADRDDFDRTLNFLNACELALDKDKYSLTSPEDNWLDLDDSDPDKKMILGIRNRLAEEEGVKEKYVDTRIVMYEYLQRKFRAASCCWRRVYWAADVLISNCCDPTEDCLEFYPGIEIFNVANEQ